MSTDKLLISWDGDNSSDSELDSPSTSNAGSINHSLQANKSKGTDTSEESDDNAKEETNSNSLEKDSSKHNDISFMDVDKDEQGSEVEFDDLEIDSPDVSNSDLDDASFQEDQKYEDENSHDSDESNNVSPELSKDLLESDLDDGTIVTENAGWAKSIARLINAPVSAKKKSAVLSLCRDPNANTEVQKKALKLRKKISTAGEIQIVGADGKIKEIDTKNKIEDGKKTTEPKFKTKKEKMVFEKGARTKPKIEQQNRERAMMRVAQKGVIQLFNAVRSQQQVIEKKLEQMGGAVTELKKDKALKDFDKAAFLQQLTGEEVKPLSKTRDRKGAWKKKKLINERRACAIKHEDVRAD